MGIDVTLFGIENIYGNYSNRNFFTKGLNKLGLSQYFFYQTNHQTIDYIKQHRPTHIIVFKGMQLYPATIAWCKKQGIFIANYNPDHPFILTGEGSGNSYVTDSVGLYDLHFCYSQLLRQQIESKYQIPTVFLPFGYELSVETYALCEQVPEVEAVCFLANPDKERVIFIKELVNQGINLAIYGHQWQRYLSPSAQLSLHPLQFQQDYWQTLRKYAVQINRLRKHNVNSHNMRTFEVPAVGGIQLADDTDEHRQFFEADKEIFLFKTPAECAEKIKFLLNLSPQQRQVIRQVARKRSVQADYTYQNRAKILLEGLRS